MNDLTITTNDITKEIITKEGKFHPIITKAADPNALTFKTIDEAKMNEIVEFMPEVNRAVQAFNKQNSQTTSSLMTLGMLEAGPYRTLRQILAQVEKKRAALKENITNLEKKKVERKMIEKQISRLAPEIKITLDGKVIELIDEEDIEYAREILEIEKDKIASDIVDATGHIEATLKELGAYKNRYEEVKKNNNIPDNWSEEDFENAEVEHHIKAMFRNAIRDRMQGSHNMGTMEYMEQFGINPIVAYALVDQYINGTKRYMSETNQAPDITAHYEFFDKMYQMFGEEYKKAVKRLGLDSITHADWLMKENK